MLKGTFKAHVKHCMSIHSQPVNEPYDKTPFSKAKIMYVLHVHIKYIKISFVHSTDLCGMVANTYRAKRRLHFFIFNIKDNHQY